MSYETTGQFRAVVGQLNDPLNDPLPSRAPHEEQAAPQEGYPPEYPAYPDPAAGRSADPSAGTPAPPGPSSRSGRSGRSGPTDPSAYSGYPGYGGYREAPERQPGYPVDDAAAGYGGYPAAEPPAPAPAPAPGSWFQPPQPAQPSPAGRPQSQEQAQPLQQPQPPAHAQPSQQRPHRRPAPDPDADQTTRMPVVVPEDEPRPAAVPDPLIDVPGLGPEAGAADGSEAEPSLAQLPVDGGRAARRKAAKGGHRARVRAVEEAPAGQEASAPLSRVEARRAAKAAKESPAVVASRVVGELFITVGVLMLLFVTYQLWWTNVRAHAQADSASNKLEQEWKTDQSEPDRAPGTFSPGQGFAIMYIPKLDVKAPIAQGVSKTKVLDHGMIGHYDGALNTAMPWDKTGNFAVAAHRNTHGEPFRFINHLAPGDKVVVETSTTYYTYDVTSSLQSTPPSNVSVLQPVPVGSGFTKPGRYLTLTTCTPEFTSTNRLIVWGKLVEERPRSKGKPDALVNG